MWIVEERKLRQAKNARPEGRRSRREQGKHMDGIEEVARKNEKGVNELKSF